ncbi:uncharacterized protein Z518_04873 [Rhinocladiella mackenziei CBS 650.93]|uniref:Uncharacterized protein n=1 Tax=Rhinocladiella mackenziei CBS 650.93 TaxID=1442369 RepID=A0A0D2FX29_9EURO|nr:uncharacterized protein Z518_04873 [Rhinocladiella mackenziei CBS 650.93]KIX06897.1 hypothetical protein Z518_04873 [Rhinocladiella mackenziei CBS 650.93]
MAATYGVRELYGGAMTVELPVEFIDSRHLANTLNSNIRQIPDHQEVFLSPTTLTSVIFEINAYVESSTPNPHPTTNTTTATVANGTTTSTSTTTTAANGVSSPSGPEADADAAKYHFTDVISPPDTLASPLPTPQRITMAKPSLAGYPAYILSGNIISYETSRWHQPSQPQLPQPHAQSASFSSSSEVTQASSFSTSVLQSLVHQTQLLIRMGDYKTDFCVRINVPMKEFGENDARVAAEETFAGDMLSRVVASLSVVDFGLFGFE